MNSQRFMAIIGVMALAAIFRVIPHPPNFAPIAAMALFAGAYVERTWLAFLLPLGAMLISDMILGFHATLPAVYLSFMVIVGVGLLLQSKKSVMRVGLATLSSSVFFFGVTNFAVWLQSGMYTRDWTGLVSCYVAALPFLDNTLIGDTFYSALFFGGWVLLEKAVPSLQDQPSAVAA